MKKIIIISDKVKNSINYKHKGLYDIIVTIDVKKEISDIYRNNNDFPVFAIVFIGIDNIDIIPLLHEYNSTTVLYKIVLICFDNELKKLNRDNIKGISDLKTSEISLIEFDLLTEMLFMQIQEQHNNQLRHLNTKRDQDDLINIGKALSTEKSPENLLKLILTLSKKITGADAGSIYLIEEDRDKGKQLRFKHSHTFRRDLPFEEFTLPLDKNSIAGYVAVTSEVLNIPDVYKLSPHDPISFNSSFDEAQNYKCKSMLVVPMKNHLDKVIGVIQLINSKEDINGNSSITGNEAFEIFLESELDFENKVVSFEKRYEGLMEAVAGQAAIAIENNRMINQIQNQFEEFVKASVTAIESRDVSTSGHAFRVADICVNLARAINDENTGFFKDKFFSSTEIKELEYAALLHDFGKVYIDLAIFKKAKKLYPKEFENLLLKLNYLYRYIELHYTLKESLRLREQDFKEDLLMTLEEIEYEKDEKLIRIKKIKESVKILNEPSVTIQDLDSEGILNEIIEEIRYLECFDIDGNEIQLLSNEEKMNLLIKRGSLNPVERNEIESHVMHSFNFVSSIPWPPEYKNIPVIILHHHEKLDGSGYPKGISGERNIPIQSRMITIADIYDALVASDRPYKKAITQENALDILRDEVDNDKLDKKLFDIFTKYQIFKKIETISIN